MRMRTPAGLDVRPRNVVRAVTHLVQWVDYQSTGNSEPSGSRARLTFYTADEPGAAEQDSAA
jgi:hypothetical protein